MNIFNSFNIKRNPDKENQGSAMGKFNNFTENASNVLGKMGFFDNIALTASTALENNMRVNNPYMNAIAGTNQGPHLMRIWGRQGELLNTLHNINKSVNDINYIANNSSDLYNTYNDMSDMYKKSNLSNKQLANVEIKNALFDPIGSFANWIKGDNAFANQRKLNNTITGALNRSYSNYLGAVSNMNKQNKYLTMSMMALGGALDYGMQNQYAINNYIDAMNKSKITSLPNSFLKPLFDSVNYFALGGRPDFNEFNTGGTHELNSNGGIPVREHSDGTIDTVEQNETMTATPDGAYVFSDRLKLSKKECELLRVPVGSTYAEASKILRKEFDEKPYDEIARRGWEQFRDILIQSLEMQKQEIASKEAREQGNYYSKMQGLPPEVMQDMYQENSQQEPLLQQGRSPILGNAFGGNIQQHAYGTYLQNNYLGNYSPYSFLSNNMLFEEDPDSTTNTTPTLGTTTPVNTGEGVIAQAPYVGPLDENEMPQFGGNNNSLRYYNLNIKDMSGFSFWNSNSDDYESEYMKWLVSVPDWNNIFTPEALKLMLEYYNKLKGTNYDTIYKIPDFTGLGQDRTYGYFHKMFDKAYRDRHTPVALTEEIPETQNTENSENPEEVKTDPENDIIFNYKDREKFDLDDLINMGALLQSLTPVDYSRPDMYMSKKLPRVNYPNNYNYATPVYANIPYLQNQLNAQQQAVLNNITNRNNPNGIASLLNAGNVFAELQGKLLSDLYEYNSKENKQTKNINNNIFNSSIQNQNRADTINLQYEIHDLNKLMQGLRWKESYDENRMKGISDNLLNIKDKTAAKRTEDINKQLTVLDIATSSVPFNDNIKSILYGIDPLFGLAAGYTPQSNTSETAQNRFVTARPLEKDFNNKEEYKEAMTKYRKDIKIEKDFRKAKYKEDKLNTALKYNMDYNTYKEWATKLNIDVIDKETFDNYKKNNTSE